MQWFVVLVAGRVCRPKPGIAGIFEHASGIVIFIVDAIEVGVIWPTTPRASDRHGTGSY